MHLRRTIRPIALLLILSALLLAGCSENRQAASETPSPVTPATQPLSTDVPRRPVPSPDDTFAALQPIEPTSSPDTKVDPDEIERRLLAAQNDPTARIEAIRELANATPAASLALLNRLFSTEHREDVKSEMLAVLADLDHTRDRDPQLALCTKALAPGQPQRVRYIAILTIADLHDARARAFLLPLQTDPDREIRTAATQALSDLAQ